MSHFPSRIVCMTEESVETIYALGLQQKIIGVSAFVERPIEAKSIKKVSAFTSANIEKIIALKPDLILGFSDIQKDIARDLIGEGLNVFIANHRSVDEILNYIMTLGHMLGAGAQVTDLLERCLLKIERGKDFAKTLQVRPKVYLEEWDEPMISGIQWFSEIFQLCGGIDIFAQKGLESMAKNRFVSSKDVIAENPDFIFPCWCGKKVDLQAISDRPGWDKITAVKKHQVIELDPAIFLQPGPAPLLDGIDQVIGYLSNYSN